MGYVAAVFIGYMFGMATIRDGGKIMWTVVGDPALVGRRIVWCGDGQVGAICPQSDFHHRDEAIADFLATYESSVRSKTPFRAGVVYNYDPDKKIREQLDEAAEWRLGKWFWDKP